MNYFTTTFSTSTKRLNLCNLNRRIIPLVKMSLASQTLKCETKDISIKVPWGEISGQIVNKSENKQESVLCLHGWLDNLNTFQPLLSLLPQEKTYVLVDLPGHGRSSHFPHGINYSMFHYVDLVERIRKHFNWTTFSLLGHSLGGNISTVYSATFPEKVDKLIMLDTLGIHPYSIMKSANQLRSSIEKNHEYENSNIPNKQYTWQDAKKRLLEGNQNLTEKSAEILLERGVIKQDNGLYEFSRDFRHRLPHQVYISDQHARCFIPNIKSHILRIIAEDGYKKIYITNENEHQVNQLLSLYQQNCQYVEEVVVPGNHHVHLNQPELVMNDITKFLQRPNRFINSSSI